MINVETTHFVDGGKLAEAHYFAKNELHEFITDFYDESVVYLMTVFPLSVLRDAVIMEAKQFKFDYTSRYDTLVDECQDLINLYPDILVKF